MKAHRDILAKAAASALPDRVDGLNDVSIEAVIELVEAGYLDAVNASSMDGTAYLRPRITGPGRKYLAALLKQEKENSIFAKLLKLASPTLKWALGIVTAVLIGLILFWLTGK